MAVKDSVLDALKEHKGNYLSGEKLSDDFGVSRAAVWKAIKSLREEGYIIDAVTNRGYMLKDAGHEITADEIRSQLPSRYKGNGIFFYDTTDSTNMRAKQLITEETSGAGSKSGDLNGTIISAGQQTAGRGRLGRSFFSPKEGIYISIIIKPKFDISESTLVTVAAASAVAEAVDEVCGREHETEIKWVNDIYLDKKKICGILTEGIADFESGQIDYMITGIGINTSLEGFPRELKKTAGAIEGDWPRAKLIAEIMSRFLDYVSRIEERRFMTTYREKSMLIGEDVLVYRGTYRKNPDDELEGIPARVTGISDEGGLEIIKSDGSREILTTGEVTVRTADGSKGKPSRSR